MTFANPALHMPASRLAGRVSGKRHSRAFGLLEVILVFAVVIGAAIAVFSVYQSARASSEASELVDQASMLAANLRASSLRQTTGYAGMTTSKAIASRVVPANMVSGGTVTSANGGSVTFLGNFLMPDGTMGFQLIFSDVNSDTCTKFVQGAARSLSPGYVLVNSEGLQSVSGGIATLGDVDPGSSGQRCSEKDLNTVTFVSQ